MIGRHAAAPRLLALGCRAPTARAERGPRCLVRVPVTPRLRRASYSDVDELGATDELHLELAQLVARIGFVAQHHGDRVGVVASAPPRAFLAPPCVRLPGWQLPPVVVVDQSCSSTRGSLAAASRSRRACDRRRPSGDRPSRAGRARAQVVGVPPDQRQQLLLEIPYRGVVAARFLALDALPISGTCSSE